MKYLNCYFMDIFKILGIFLGGIFGEFLWIFGNLWGILWGVKVNWFLTSQLIAYIFKVSWLFTLLKSADFGNSLGILCGILWELSMIVYIFKSHLVSYKSADCLHFQSQLIVYIVKVSWFFTLLKSADFGNSLGILIFYILKVSW